MKTVLALTILVTVSAISGFSQTNKADAVMPDQAVIAIILGKSVALKDKDKLSGLIFGALVTQYAKENKIEATEDEINTFLIKMAAKERQDEILYEQDKERLLKELNSSSLSNEQRKVKKSELETIEYLLKSRRETRGDIKKFAEQMRPLMRSNARDWVMKWKINKSLYQKYGGRIIFQQAGVEPVDAYRDFLKDQEKKGAFRIFSKADEASFWNYYTHDALHTFYKKDDGEKLMEKPFWLMDKPLGE